MIHYVSNKQHRTAYTRVLLGFLLACLLLQAAMLYAKRQPLAFGMESSLNLYPTSVSTTGWGAVDTTLIQDLDDDAIYQHFSENNSAYYLSNIEVLPNQRAKPTSQTIDNGTPVPSITDEPSVQNTEVVDMASSTGQSLSVPEQVPDAPEETLVDEEEFFVPVSEPEQGAVAEPESESEPEIEPESEPVSEVEVPAAEEVSLRFRILQYTDALFPVVTQVFPFVQQNTSTPVTHEPAASELEQGAVAEPESESEPEIEPESEPVSEVDVQTADSVSGDDTAQESEIESDNTLGITSVGQVAGTSTETEVSSTSAANATTSGSVESDVVVQSGSVEPMVGFDDNVRDDQKDVPSFDNEVVLRGFAAPDLESGEFITGMQLRVSLAGQLRTLASSSSSVPYVEVLYGSAEEMQSVGVILLDNEVSNAMNGGFFLFALPQLTTLASLNNAQVVIRYQGDRAMLDGLYLDAAWIEVDTKRVTREDLLNRGVADKINTLKRPQVAELVSTKTNFKRTEIPVFNLRYQSQRNILVRGVRSAMGRNLVAVQDVKVTHRALGESGVAPHITATDEGLVTIQFDNDDLQYLRPGEYTVNVTYDEGGATYTDSFSFLWGILTINPNKTEYEAGQRADLSIGALTPSGNTVCHATLDLYVIDPNDFITKVPVSESGACDGNNIIDVPDFSATYNTSIAGTYELYLERLDDDGSVLSFTTDTFKVVADQAVSIERRGPTRIYPPAPYPMELTIEANTTSFDGQLVERVPEGFKVSSTTATMSRDGDWQVLTWDVSLLAGSEQTVGYTFDAPDVSPYLYEVGPARLEGEGESSVVPDPTLVTAGNSSSTPPGLNRATSTVEESAERELPDGVLFLEHRQWQIASDALGNMHLFYDDTEASLPSTWDCVSCTSGDDFFETFIRASSTYNNTGGALTHTHGSVSTLVNNTTAGVAVEFQSGTVLAANTHSHTASITLGSGSNVPEYRELRVIRYNVSAGEPADGDIPQGAIAIFDASVPTGWTRYSAQDGYYIRGGNSPGTVSGSNTHTHTITSGTLNASTGAIGRRGGAPNVQAINTGHTHTVTGSSASANHEPEYIEVILGEIDADGDPVNGMIAMWDAAFTNNGGWTSLSSDPSDPFTGRFLKAASTYGTTGGANSHSHATTTVASGNAIGGTTSGRTTGASDGVLAAHTHNVDISTSDDTHLPPYLAVNFAKRLGLDATFSQLSYRWYVDNDAEPPTNPWDNDSIDLTEREPISATSTPVKDGDELRLRINALVNNATATAGARFQLQYASTTAACSAATGWENVGQTGSSTIWRGFNTSVTDHATLSSTTLASSTVGFTFEENGYATGTPSDIGEDGVGEWDFALQNNGAAAGTTYCFRLVDDTGGTLFAYQSYPRLFTDEAPNAPTLSKLFDNEKTPSTTPLFNFSATDPEGQTLHYEIEIDTDTDFTSGVVIDRNTISHEDDFLNLANEAAKPEYDSGDLIQFEPQTSLASGTTYYWRVRAQAPDGSDEWGDWSEVWSFTVDPNLSAAAWFQTEDEQFDTNANVGVESGSNSLSFISGSTTGTSTSGAIVFTDGDVGTAWDSLRINDTGSITYYVEYQDENDAWQRIPDGDLSGNSTGLTDVDSPVNLLTLDTDTYGTLRLVAVFTNAVSPILQDWEIRWGFRVETPTLDSPFPNEQVGTSTPTFGFVTTDPQNDGLTYQIQWSPTPDFTASTTRTSDTDTGFEDVSTGSTTDPFDSGDDVRFTIQAADALSASTTYWWRVRARDSGPGGANAYSFWTDAQSFTYIPATEVSTWYQTSAEQFDSNILSGTVSLSNDSVSVATTASEAMIVYGEGVEEFPRYRTWDGSAWSNEGQLGDIDSSLRWSVVRAGTTREEYVAGTVGNDADLYVHVYSEGVWSTPNELTTSVAINSTRGFDIAYETLSGDAMVVYCDGDANPSYRVWDGSSWGTETGITSSLGDACRWVDLASHPNDNELALIIRGVSGDPYQVFIWNATSTTWTSGGTFGAARNSTYSGQDIMYESGGDILAVAPSPGGGPNRFVYNAYTGSWSGGTTQTIAGRLYWSQLARDPLSDEILMCYQNEDSEVQAITWSGTAWSTDTQFSATVNADTDPGFACVYDNDNDGVGVYGDGTNTDYRLWNGTSWGGATTVNSLTTTDTSQLIRTGVGTVLGAFYDGDTTSALEFASWDGSSWSSTQTLESGASVTSSPYGQPYFMAPRNANSAGTTIVTPGIDFDDGLGPFWDSFSWNDANITGDSEIIYRLQYQTATGSWAFIPAGDLPGNDTGTTTGPFDLSGLNTVTYNVLRPYAELTCDGGGACPELLDWRVTWAGGITVSGTIDEYDQTTDVTTGSVGVAVNGVEQAGKTGTIDGSGNWSITNVTAFAGDMITVFVDGAAVSSQAVGVTRYAGTGNLTGMQLYEQHITIGTGSATTTPYTNADVGSYDTDDNSADIFFDLTGTTLDGCAVSSCGAVRILVDTDAVYAPGGQVLAHDFENNGTFTAGSYTHEFSGSWDNNGTTTMTGSTIVMSATSTTESIDSTGAVSDSFSNLTLGTTTGSGTWTLGSTLDVNGALTVSRGTLDRGTTAITVAGTLTTGANGLWTGVGTTTLDGASASNWRDQNATLQNVGDVVIDGTNKLVTLTGNVAANSITIGVNDTLDVSASFYDITVYEDWDNQNNFLPRSGEVFFAATTSGHTIATNGDVFYDATFNGVGGDWTFTDSTVTINNDLTISTGTVALPSNGTTTIAGSFDATGGTFQNNNGTLYFTSNSAETITFDGSDFLNVARNLTFNGGGSWTITDTNATATSDVRIQQGDVTFPSGIFAIGGTLTDSGGSFVGNTGTVRFYSSASETLTAGGSSFASIIFDGTGDWTFGDTNVTATEDLSVLSGSLTMPSGTFTLGGSYDNQSTVVAGTGELLFNSNDTGETISFGSSNLYDVTFNNAGGGWTLTGAATTTNNLSLTNANDWTLNAGLLLSVGGTFTNSIGASTTWNAGSTLSLEAGSYSINTSADVGDSYDTLRIKSDTDIAMWNSIASTYDIDSTGSLYSQDHNAVDGELYIFGDYNRTSGTEYWNSTIDFDGTDLTGGSERQVDVRFAAGASATIDSATLNITGSSTASTTVANQGSGTYTVSVSSGTTTAQYYEFADLGLTGLSLLSGTIVPTLQDGSYIVAADGGTAITLSSTTIDTNSGKQIYNVTFATNTAISANNVSQTDGAPSSFWWFRQGQGNLYGEQFDNDTGNPGSVRFDDSALVLSISGTVYEVDTTTPLGAPTCDNSTQVIDVYVDGVFSTSTSCNAGVFTASGVTVVGDPTITVFLNDAPGGEVASAITRTPTANISGFDLYENRVVVRNEDTEALTIANLAVMDESDDTDLRFVAATSTSPDTLSVRAGNELFVFASSTFTPDGVVTLNGNAGANSYDGTLYLDGDATFTATGTVTVGGRLVLESGATFMPASSTVLMTASTTGKSVTGTSEITFHDLSFIGSGDWNLGADLRVLGDMTVSAGTVTGTNDITLPHGSLSGNGVLSLGGGTVTIESTNTLGGTTAWTFNNLTLGDAADAGTTTPQFTSTTTIGGVLTIDTAHFLDAGATSWDLAGTGNVLVENGVLQEDTSTFRYSGNGANVTATRYYNLDINAGAGTPTYVAGAIGLPVTNRLTVGGESSTTLTLATNNPAFDVDGDVLIRGNGSLLASASGAFTIGGDYDNDGTLTANGGTITFDGSGTHSIAAGQSSFATAVVDAAGDYTVSEHATATTAFTLTAAGSFTLDSGQVLAVGGIFTNGLDGADTTWTGSTLRLYGGGDYTINTKTFDDSYATLSVAADTQIRMWNSDATTYNIAPTGSLYSMDHADNPGDLYIYGAYTKTNANDFWSYSKDFDGTTISGRPADVYMATSSSLLITGGSLAMIGDASNGTTTIQSSATDLYDFRIGGTASVTMQYYAFRDMDTNGLSFSGTPDIKDISYGDFELAITGDTTITVGSSVINSNPAKTFNYNRFALGAAANGFNVTATNTAAAVSAWRFFGHHGDIDGEDYDVDSGDPGELLWDNSTSTIDISGRVYQSDTSTVSNACGGGANIHLYVNGALEDTTSCDGGSGLFSFSDVNYSSGESVVVYINNETENAVTVSTDLVSSVFNFDLYEDHLIVRHESTDPIEITDLDDWDSDQDSDGDIFFDAEGGADTLVLDSNTTLVVWDNKEFEPGGSITTGGGAGTALDGTIELQDGATLTLNTGESHSIGGNLEMGSGATFTPAQATVTFTSSGSGRTIDTNESGFYNLILNGAGTFSSSDAALVIGNDLTLTNGSLTLPTATTTITGSLSTTGGSFDAGGGVMVFDSDAAETVTASSSNFSAVHFTGSGSWAMNDAAATATRAVTIYDGTVTLPSGSFTVGGSFRNLGGSVAHNTSELVMVATTTATVLASSSDLYAVTIADTGAFAFEDEHLTLLDTLAINAGSLVLASGTLAIGGSFDAAGGTFDHASGTILFNSSDGGETIDPGSSPFYAVQVGAPAGGYTLTGHATTATSFNLASANSFVAQSGTVLYVGTVFTNSVGGASTTWLGSTLVLDGENAYTLNSKSTAEERYDELVVGTNSDIRVWNTAATTTTVANDSSLYSQDHAGVDGDVYVYGDFHIDTMSEYWSYATDFDGTALGGSSRAVTVSHAANASTTVDGGALVMVGDSGNETTVTNQGAGTYTMAVTAGTFNADYYTFRNLDSDGLQLLGTSTIVSLDNGDFELAVDTGTLVTVASTTVNANASMIISGNRFATSSAISGSNITLTGTTASVWTYTGHTGNLGGEGYDVDGATACGSIRWDDSDCQITQQTHYRWRSDTGNVGVPDTEWFHADWDARKRVRVENSDAQAYTDAVVELTVDYDSDMQADFDDLRFTDSSGTTTIPYWVGSSTNSTVAEVWVKVPTLPASDYATIFMYYNNPTALSSSSVSDTFEAGDDFEDGDIAEYSGETSDFTVNSTFAYDGSYGLDAVNNTGKTESGGMYDLSQQVAKGQTIRYLQYIDTAGSNDEVCTKFGIQTTAAPASNYAVCLEVSGVDRIEIVRDAVSDDASGVELATSSVPGGWVTGWYEVEIDWEEDDDIIASLYRNDTLVTSATANDGNYDDGGIGFTFWFQRGGWDSYTARNTLTTEPTIRFGAEQSDGGATWLAALDTAYTGATVGATTRLRLLVENSGTAITNQQFTLEFAEQGDSPSCEAVALSTYSPVPVQASCGTSPICMQTSGNVTNGESTTDLLDAGEGDFTPGEAREDPSNTTGNLDVAQDEYTELEYVITPTINVNDENICFRVSNNETDYDTYLRVAKMSIKFDPSISVVNFNEITDIALLPGTTTRVYATSTVTDLNGYSDLQSATSTFYTTTATAACTADNNDCYISTTAGGQCSYTNCSGNSCELVCYADMFFHADATASDGGAFWYAFVEAEDTAGGTGFNTSSNIDVDELPALNVNGTIDYGQVAPETDTGADNASTTILNLGNIPIDIEIESTDLSDGFSSVIPGEDQKFSSTTFDYSSCGAGCVDASTTTSIPLNFDLAKPTVDAPPVSKDVFWGISIPFGINSAPHSGFNTFYAIDDT